MRLCCVSHFSSCLHLSQCSPILFFFSDCFISVLLRAGQQSPWSPGQHTIVSLCVTAVSSTGVSIPKAPFLFVLLSGGAAALSVVRYHQFSANHQHILCNLLQSISTDASCLQPDNIPQWLLEQNLGSLQSTFYLLCSLLLFCAFPRSAVPMGPHCGEHPRGTHSVPQQVPGNDTQVQHKRVTNKRSGSATASRDMSHARKSSDFHSYMFPFICGVSWNT